MTASLAPLIETSLGAVCHLVTDGTHDTPKRVDTGYPLIKAKEITGGRIDFMTCDQISEIDHRAVISRSKPEFGDTLFAHIGASLGECAFHGRLINLFHFSDYQYNYYILQIINFFLKYLK